jgi:hypothetical protein
MSALVRDDRLRTAGEEPKPGGAGIPHGLTRCTQTDGGRSRKVRPPDSVKDFCRYEISNWADVGLDDRW